MSMFCWKAERWSSQTPTWWEACQCQSNSMWKKKKKKITLSLEGLNGSLNINKQPFPPVSYLRIIWYCSHCGFAHYRWVPVSRFNQGNAGVNHYEFLHIRDLFYLFRAICPCKTVTIPSWWLTEQAELVRLPSQSQKFSDVSFSLKQMASRYKSSSVFRTVFLYLACCVAPLNT